MARRASGTADGGEDPRDQWDVVDAHVDQWSSVFADMDPEVEGAITRIQTIGKHVGRLKHQAWSGTDDTVEDYFTLHALQVTHHPEAEATPAQLADDCGVTRAAMTSRIDRLLARGHVTRQVDPADRRRVIVRSTESGKALWERGIHVGIAQEQAVLAPLTAAELTQLNSLLRKVVKQLGTGPDC